VARWQQATSAAIAAAPSSDLNACRTERGVVKRRGPPSQGWQPSCVITRQNIAAMDLFVVPTIGFRLLYGFVIIRLDRRDVSGSA
jgi:hypothetical protein